MGSYTLEQSVERMLAAVGILLFVFYVSDKSASAKELGRKQKSGFLRKITFSDDKIGARYHVGEKMSF